MNNEGKRHAATRRVSTTAQTPTAFCIHRAAQRERISFRTSPRVRFLPSFRQLAGEISNTGTKVMCPWRAFVAKMLSRFLWSSVRLESNRSKVSSSFDRLNFKTWSPLRDRIAYFQAESWKVGAKSCWNFYQSWFETLYWRVIFLW